MRLAVVGAGYVGLVAGTCLAETGHDVILVDVDEHRVKALRSGEVPFFEPGLSEMLQHNIRDARMSFTSDLAECLSDRQVVFIAVGTPQGEDGSADLSYVLRVAQQIGQAMAGPLVVVIKSTVPVGTAAHVKEAILAQTAHPVVVVSNPEFLKEGSAVGDFLKPDRVVIGTEDEQARKIMGDLYAPFLRTGNPILFMDNLSAEMTKYCANGLLAARISFMNEIAQLCDAVGADVDMVRRGAGADRRIGYPFLFPGIGYGGSCFPKDVRALARTGREHGLEMNMLEATDRVNDRQKSLIGERIIEYFGKDLSKRRFAVWGLAFKPRTDDVREAPALVIIEDLLKAGARVRVYDPEAMDTARLVLGDRVTYCSGNYQALRGADALIVATEWNAFRRPDFDRVADLLRQPLIFDGRNIYDPQRLAEQGFEYIPIGRSRHRRAQTGKKGEAKYHKPHAKSSRSQQGKKDKKHKDQKHKDKKHKDKKTKSHNSESVAGSKAKLQGGKPVGDMTITFFGAAKRVTGSCSLVRCAGKNIMVDCGMVQGSKDANELNREVFPIEIKDIDAVVLTHGHLDHSGRVPRLVSEGYTGPIIAHGATGELAEIVWRDSARLSSKYDGGPLYSDGDCDKAVSLLKRLRYKQSWDLGGVEIQMFDAGHILGSSHVMISGAGKKLLMSGDIGSPNTPIIRDPTSSWDTPVDAVVIESTYGNRLHKSREDTIEEFKKIVLEAIEHKGFVLIPAFAIGRTQELLFHFNTMVTNKRLPRVPVLLDSPMAEKVTAVYRQHRECYDEATWKLIEQGNAPMRFEGFRELVTAQDSKSVQGMAPPAVVIAGSGMCTGGRILHHLKYFVERSSTTVVFVGWQGYGTLGRRMVDGDETIKVHGQRLEVNARIETLNGFSAHADRDALVAWSRNLKGEPKFLVNHGEEDAVAGLVEALTKDGHGKVVGVEEDETYTI